MPTTATFGTFTLATPGGADVLIAKLDGVTGTALVKSLVQMLHQTFAHPLDGIGRWGAGCAAQQ